MAGLVALGLSPVLAYLLWVRRRAATVSGAAMLAATTAGWLLWLADRDDAMSGLSVLLGYVLAAAAVVYGATTGRSQRMMEG